MLRWICRVACFSILLLAASGRTSASSGWKPVTARDLALTAAEMGDPDADAAILFREGDLNDNYSDGTNLKVYIRIKVFNERGRRWADVQIPYRVEQGRVTDVHARTVRQDGTEVEVDGRDIFDNVLLRTSHGKWHAKVFSMPAVEAGSIIEYRYRQVYPDGFKYFALDLQSDLYTKKLFYRIQPQAASKLDMRWVTFNAHDPNRFLPQWDGSYYIRATDIAAFRREALMPPERAVKIWGWLYYSDALLAEPDKYWSDYSARAYAKTEAETRPSRAIRHTVEVITLADDGMKSKVARVYEYVQKEIRNIGYRETSDLESASEAELRPNDSADDTIRRRYGTPAEINRLFIAMLRACGLDARVAELTTRDEATFHRSFADAFQFNSEVAAVLDNEQVQFFDPGTPFCSPGMLSWEKEAVPALIHGRKGNPFVDTPLTDSSRSRQERLFRVEVFDDGRITGRADVKLFGQRASEVRAELADLSLAARQKRLASREKETLIPMAVDQSTVSQVEDGTAAEFAFRYLLRAPHAATRTERRILFRPAMLARRHESFAVAPRRYNSLYFRYPWSEVDRVEIRPPAGCKIEQLPKPIEVDIGAARYRATFSKVNDQVVFERSLSINAIYLSPSQYPAFKAFFDRVHQLDRAFVSFRQD